MHAYPPVDVWCESGRTEEHGNAARHRAANPQAFITSFWSQRTQQVPRSRRGCRRNRVTAKERCGSGIGGLKTGGNQHRCVHDRSRCAGSRLAAPSGQGRPGTFDLSLPQGGRARLACLRPPLGCVRFRPGGVRRERVGPRHARSQGRAARGSGPAQGRAFLSGRLCPAKETAPEGADAGTTPAGPPGQREGSKS